ncbi:MAG: choice-of-anchor J domain-containing protein [Hyphomicrobiales bacterium]
MYKYSTIYNLFLALILCSFSGVVKAQTDAKGFKESFEGDFPPSGWQVKCGTANKDGWSKDDGTTQSGPGANDGSYVAMADMYGLNANVKADLISPALDFSTLNNPILEFDWQIKHDVDPQPKLKVLISTDGGTTFTETLFEESASYRTNSWRTEKLFIDNTLSNAVIKFEATSDYGSHNMFLDNIKITEAPTNPVAYIEKIGTSFDVLDLNTQATSSFDVRNIGSENLIINSIDTEDPFTISNSFPITLAKGESTTINLLFAPTVAGAYQKTLKLKYNEGATGDDDFIVNGVGIPKTYSYEGFEEELIEGWEIQTISNQTWEINTYGGIEGDQCLEIGSKFQAAEYHNSTSRIILPEIETTDGNIIAFYAYRTGRLENPVFKLEYYNEESQEYVTLQNIPLGAYPSLYAFSLDDIPVNSAKLAFYAETGDEYSGIALDGIRYPQAYVGTEVPKPTKIVFPKDYKSDLPIEIDVKWERNPKARGTYFYLGTNKTPTMPTYGEALPEGWVDAEKATTRKVNLEYGKTYRWAVVPYNENGTPSNIKVHTFTTYNDPIITDFPYTQDFEKAFPPIGWLNKDGMWYRSGLKRSGNYSAGTSKSHKGAAILETPKVKIGNQGLRCSFHWKDAGYNEMIDQIDLRSRIIGLDTTYFEVSADNGETWEILDLKAGQQSAEERTFTKSQVDLSKYKNKTVTFRFRDVNWQSANSYGVSVDDFLIEEAPTEPIPEMNYREWSFGDVAVNIKENAPTYFSLYNDGPGKLKVKSISGLEGTAFSTDFDKGSVNLDYWKNYNFIIYVTAPTKGEHKATSTITTTNDKEIKVELSANAIDYTNTVVKGGFEEAISFASVMSPFISIDNDKKNIGYIRDHYFKGQNDKRGFFIFNPHQTFPPLSSEKEYLAHSGDKFAASYSIADQDPNNIIDNDDWLICPRTKIKNGDFLRLWAKSVTDAYGYERFKVLVSTSDNPRDLTAYKKISEGDYLEAPDIAWAPFDFNLSPYINKDIYIAVQCVSSYAFMLMIDDIEIISPTGTRPIATFEDGIEVFPNPADNYVNITCEAGTHILVTDIKGRVIKEDKNNTTTNLTINTQNLAEGIYLVKMRNGENTSVRKLIIKH